MDLDSDKIASSSPIIVHNEKEATLEIGIALVIN